MEFILQVNKYTHFIGQSGEKWVQIGYHNINNDIVGCSIRKFDVTQGSYSAIRIVINNESSWACFAEIAFM